jgi:hypothetical protein
MGFCTRALLIAAAGLAAVLAALPARADHQPAIVVPGRPDVPIIVDGVVVNGAIISGDWGLYRPGHGYRIIEGGCCPEPAVRRTYFPMTGREPAYGRKEVEPKPRPRPSTHYEKSWSVHSQPGPVTEYPPYELPPVVIAPRVR